MKLNFTQEHNIYYILETIKKIPSYKKNITVSIDRNHVFFDHQRWGEQLKNVITTNELDIKFQVFTEKQREFYTSFGFLTLDYKPGYFHFFSSLGSRVRGLPLLYLLVVVFCLYVGYHIFFSVSYIHITPKNYIDTIVFNAFLCKKDLYTCSSKHIPLQSGSLTISLNKTKNVDMVLYNSTPSQGFITIYNYLPYEVQLLANTRFAAESGEIFFINRSVKLYASDGIYPTNAQVRVVSQTINDAGEFFGTTTNKPKGTKLLAVNLPESFNDGKLYAVVRDGLEGGKLIETNKNLDDELESIKTELQNEVKDNIFMYVSKNTNDNQIILYDKRFVDVNNLDVQTSISYDGETPFVLATATLSLQYYYISVSDIGNIIKSSLNFSDSAIYLYDTIDISKLQFEDFLEIEPGLYQTPVRTQVLYYYDFKNDGKKIIEEVISKIQGLSFQQAYSIVMSYDVILKASIKNSFGWSNTINKDVDRILFFLDSE